jgi:hypothetical protein
MTFSKIDLARAVRAMELDKKIRKKAIYSFGGYSQDRIIGLQ